MMRQIAEIKDLWDNVLPLNVFEVGSRGGAFADLDLISNAVDYFGFEPDPVECQRLNVNSKHSSRFRSERYFSFAVGSCNGTATLNITSQPGCSSFLVPDMEIIRDFGRDIWFEVVDRIEVKVAPLDEILVNESIDCIHFLKIDVEGYERSILEGADRVLEGLLGIRLEVNYLDHRKGQAQFSEIISFLEKKGFRIFQFLENHAWRPSSIASEHCSMKGYIPYSRGQLAHGDVLLFRDPVPFSKFDDYDPMDSLRYAMLLYGYGFLDHSKKIVDIRLVQDFMLNNLKIKVLDSAYLSASRDLRWMVRVQNLQVLKDRLVTTLNYFFSCIFK